MKRFLFVVVVALGAVALAVPAQASALPAHTVSGTFAGTGTVDGAGGCAFHTTANATGDISPFGTSTSLAFEFCPTGIVEPRPATGTFSVSGGTGTVTGTLTGQIQGSNPTPDGFPYHFDLTVTSATGAFAGATGTIALDGFFSAGALTVNGTASGTLFYGTPIATTRQDCANHGWRTMTDANGNPFKNLGQCVAFVSMRTP